VEEMSRILLGKTADNERIYLSKHKWDCGWYWGMGYVGNNDSHFHFESYLKGTKYNVTDHFVETKIIQNEWWILRDLFIQAYALKRCAEVYSHGGHQTSKEGITDIIRNEVLAKTLNADLEKILNKIWEVMEEINKR
jgi:hypothetical protein